MAQDSFPEAIFVEFVELLVLERKYPSIQAHDPSDCLTELVSQLTHVVMFSQKLQRVLHRIQVFELQQYLDSHLHKPVLLLTTRCNVELHFVHLSIPLQAKQATIPEHVLHSGALSSQNPFKQVQFPSSVSSLFNPSLQLRQLVFDWQRLQYGSSTLQDQHAVEFFTKNPVSHVQFPWTLMNASLHQKHLLSFCLHAAHPIVQFDRIETNVKAKRTVMMRNVFISPFWEQVFIKSIKFALKTKIRIKQLTKLKSLDQDKIILHIMNVFKKINLSSSIFTTQKKQTSRQPPDSAKKVPIQEHNCFFLIDYEFRNGNLLMCKISKENPSEKPNPTNLKHFKPITFQCTVKVFDKTIGDLWIGKEYCFFDLQQISDENISTFLAQRIELVAERKKQKNAEKKRKMLILC